MKKTIVYQPFNLILFFLSILFIRPAIGQTNMVTYAGNSGAEVFNDALQLSNGNVLIVGTADNLNWVSNGTPLTPLIVSGITNNQGTNKFPFLLLFNETITSLLHVFYLPQNAAEDLRFIKTTTSVGQATGDIFISGNTSGSGSTGGYFIGKLDNNFVNGNPAGFTWIYNVYAKAGSSIKIYQPWDVGGDGRVVYAYGDSHDYNWSAVYRLTASGNPDVVPDWRIHTPVSGGQYLGSAYNYPGGVSAIASSAIVFKRDGSRCELRSPTAVDYNTWLPDGNGGMKKGKWPLDVLFNTHCSPGVSNTTNGKGYTGYSPAATATYGPASICIDRRNNHMYIGFNAKSVLPDGLPDFEPAVMAMDNNGALKWWSRLYHEVTPAGDTVNSSPDQYIDALAVDYSRPAATGYLVVGARCHGNNVENLWEGNRIAANAGANGFQNSFTGSGGNFHLSWIGKLTLGEGTLMHSTYMGELADMPTNTGSASTNPLLDGWPSPNTGWPGLNTTYLGKNAIKVTADGSVLVIGTGRRTITTSNAYQKMIKPSVGKSCWNDFVRVYTPDLSMLKYSSLVVGNWDISTGADGDNVRLSGVLKTDKGIIALGRHTGSGGQLPIASVPSWGNSTYNGESAVLAYYQSTDLADINDAPLGGNVVLPVGLLRFTGETIGTRNVLNWETSFESNNRGFYLQKSTDGVSFKDLAFVATRALNGNSDRPIPYHFADAETAPGATYYRVKQADRDGKQLSSNVVKLMVKTGSIPALYCYPNPATDLLNLVITLPSGRQMQISVYDGYGRKVVSVFKEGKPGKNEIPVITKNLAAGIYHITVGCDSDCTALKYSFLKE